MANIGLSIKNCRLVILEDIVNTKGKLVDNLEVETEFICKEQPDTCYHCDSSLITGVEVIGGYDGILLWECDDCGEMMLRFAEETTEKYLQLAKGLWTNPSDWGYVPRSEFN